MKKIVLVLVLAINLFANENYKISTEIEVSGLVENSIKLNVKELEKMSYFKSGSTPVVCMSGETKDNVESYEGVLLRDIIDKAILKVNSRKEYNNLYFKAISYVSYFLFFSSNSYNISLSILLLISNLYCKM